MRHALMVAAFAVLASSCGGTAPMPSLTDYSHGASRTVEALRPLLEGAAVPADLFASPAARAPLEELAARWNAAAAPGGFLGLRIVDFERHGARRCRVAVEVRRRGAARSGGDGRVAVVQVFDLELSRADERAAWSVAAARTRAVPLQRGAPHLVEAAVAHGLSWTNESLDPLEATNACVPATHHRPGVLLADVDGDRDLDVILPGKRPRLFLNDGLGRFRDATAGSGLDTLPDAEGAGGVAADLDGDGLPELFLSNHVDPCRLLRNLGGGRFRDVTGEWGLAGVVGPFTSAAFLDADGDGRLDLFVACYGDARHTGPAFDGFNGGGDRFFRNVARAGHPFFVDESAAAGLGDVGWGFAVSACDFDGDGDDDLYLANDFGVNSLFENRSTPGRPRFVNIAKESGTEDEGYGMGVAWGDYDGDGRFDLHVTDYWTPYRWILRDSRWPMPPLPGASLVRPFMAKKMARRSRGDGLFRNLGGRRFERTSDSAGVADGGWAWGTEFVDLAGTGREDLLVVNGMYKGKSDDEIAFWNGMGREGVAFHDGIWGGIDFGDVGMASMTPKKLFRNNGDGTFEDRAYVDGFDTLGDTRGLAYGDLDGDGAPELVVSCFREPVLLYENRWDAPRVTVLLEQPDGPNRDALGALVTLTAGGRAQHREVRAGSSYLSQSSREVLFGLGEARRAESVTVRWPGGAEETLHDVPAGSRVLWTRGAQPRVVPLRPRGAGSAAATVRPGAGLRRTGS